MNPYLMAGYKIIDLADTAAAMKLPKQFRLSSVLLLFAPPLFILYLIYYLFTKSDGQKVVFRTLPSGEVVASGHTLEVVKRRKKKDAVNLIILFVLIAIVILTSIWYCQQHY